MLRQITYQGVFEPTEGSWFSVYFPDLPGCTSCGETLSEAKSCWRRPSWTLSGFDRQVRRYEMFRDNSRLLRMRILFTAKTKIVAAVQR